MTDSSEDDKPKFSKAALEKGRLLFARDVTVVDLPGYGYARASKTDIARWTRLTRQFLRGRANLRRVFLLIDSRHGLKVNDLELMSMLDETAVTYQLILTKIDKLKKGEAEKVYATEGPINKSHRQYSCHVLLILL